MTSKNISPPSAFSVPGSTNSSSVTLTADVNAPYGVSKVVFSVEGEKVGERNEKPYAVSYSIPASQNNSTIDVEVTVEDRNGNTSKSTGSISVAY